ncbi:MAG TPA: tail-specific protease, partial [Pseudomonas sp.]|nr:tail-specific protease [Pseudomonas sp.]
DSIRAAISPDMNPFKPFLTELKARHEARTNDNPDFVFTRDRLALTQELTHETTISLNEDKRRAQQERIEERQLALENTLRKAKGEEPLAKLEREDETTPHIEDKKIKPEDDAYLSESGRILLDYLGVQNAMAKNNPVEQ